MFEPGQFTYARFAGGHNRTNGIPSPEAKINLTDYDRDPSEPKINPSEPKINPSEPKINLTEHYNILSERILVPEEQSGGPSETKIIPSD